MTQSLTKWFEAQIRKIQDETLDILNDTLQDGRDLTKEYIATRGTVKSGKPGRIDTGEMYDAVSASPARWDGDVAEGSFGYKNAKDYFQYQEEGFRHVSGVTVEGMFALSDAGDQAFQELKRRLGNA